MSSIKVIDGKKLHAEMLAEADKAVAGKGDGRISEADAKEILKHLDNDPHKVGRDTIEHIKGAYRLTSGGETALRVSIRPVHILPKTRPSWTGSHTPGVAFGNDYIFLATLGTTSGKVWAAKWQVIDGDHFYPGSSSISSSNRGGISSLFMRNVDKPYIFITYNRNGTSSEPTAIVVGRYFVDKGYTTYWDIELPSEVKALDSINCVSNDNNLIYLSWEDSSGGVHFGTIEFKGDEQDSKPIFKYLKNTNFSNYPISTCGAPTLVKCSWSGEQHIMIYYTTYAKDYEHKSNFCAAYYNPITNKFSNPKIYNAEMLINSRLTARNLTDSCIQLVAKHGSESIKIVEIEHDKEPAFSSRAIDGLNAGFNESSALTFVRIGIDDYLFYYDTNGNINYYLMPEANQL